MTMNTLQTVGLILALVGLLGTLWENGWLALTSKRALVFVGKVYGKGPIRLKMKSATGSVRRKIPLRQGSHTFILEPRLTAGTITATLRDGKTKQEWQLTSQFPSVTFTAENGGFGKGYLLTLRFEKADGEATLSWQ